MIRRYRLSGTKPQDTGGKPFCAFGMRAGIFPRRGLVEVYGASCTYIDVRRPSSSHFFDIEKGRKGWLSLPPWLVGANEGGTDRPVCTLPLSGSCRPRSVHVASWLGAAACLSPFLSHQLLRNSADREAGVLCSG